MSGCDRHAGRKVDVIRGRADLDQPHGDRLGHGHRNTHATGHALTLGHRGRRDRHGEGRQFREHTEDLRDQFRAVDERVPVALVLGVNEMIAALFRLADRVLKVPLQQGGEKSEDPGRIVWFVGKFKIDRVCVAPVIAHRHVEHGPGKVALLLRPRRPDATLSVVVIIETLKAVRRSARRVGRVERISLVVVAVAAGRIDRTPNRTQVEKITGVGALPAHPARLGPEVLPRPRVQRDGRVAIPRGVPGRNAAVAVNEPDVERVERILIKNLQRVPSIGRARGVRNDRVVANDAVQRSLQSGPGQTFGRRVVSLRRGVLRPAPGLECNEQNKNYAGENHGML